MHKNPQISYFIQKSEGRICNQTINGNWHKNSSSARIFFLKETCNCIETEDITCIINEIDAWSSNTESFFLWKSLVQPQFDQTRLFELTLEPPTEKLPIQITFDPYWSIQHVDIKINTLKDWTIWNKNNFNKHMVFKFFIILFGNIINGFFSVLYVKNSIPQMTIFLLTNTCSFNPLRWQLVRGP